MLPIHIVTGFLGSGKTTFLNHFIKERPQEKILVIENECGDTNIDGALIMDTVEEIVELSAGCLCCSLSNELIEVLHEISHKKHFYDRLVIETTGIADPSSIIQVFLENPYIEKHFELQQVICLADSSLMEEWLRDTEEALRQLALSDCILINKIDLMDREATNKVEQLAKGINPNAEVFMGAKGEFPIEQILSVGTIRPETVEAISQLGHHHHEHALEGNNDHKITSFSIVFPYPLNLDKLTIELDRIVNLYRHQVYRVKGFIAVPGYDNRVSLQSARSVFVATEGSAWKPSEAREGVLVFIGRNLKPKVFEKIFKRYMVKPLAY